MSFDNTNKNIEVSDSKLSKKDVSSLIAIMLDFCQSSLHTPIGNTVRTIHRGGFERNVHEIKIWSGSICSTRGLSQRVWAAKGFKQARIGS
jgi:hypothetical protein